MIKYCLIVINISILFLINCFHFGNSIYATNETEITTQNSIYATNKTDIATQNSSRVMNEQQQQQVTTDGIEQINNSTSDVINLAQKTSQRLMNPQDGTSGDILSLLGISTTTEGPKRPTGNFDKYLDTILSSVSKTMRTGYITYEMTLQSRVGGFDPLKVKRVMQCRNCSVEGLSMIRRGGPSNLNYANRSLVIDAYIHLPAIYIHCFPCSETIFSISISGMIEIVLWDLQIFGKLIQKFERGANPELAEYKVVDEGKLEVKFHSYGWLAPFVEFGFNFVQGPLSSFMREFIYERLPTFVVKQLKGFSLPFGK